MSFINAFNCIMSAVVAWIVAGLFTEETHGRAAGVLGVVRYSLKRFKAVLRAFSCLVVNSAITTQKAVFGACRHLKRSYITVRHIQAKQKTATTTGLLSGLYYVVLRTTKHSFDIYLWLIYLTPPYLVVRKIMKNCGVCVIFGIFNI